jgi:hypothetical protein
MTSNPTTTHQLATTEGLVVRCTRCGEVSGNRRDWFFPDHLPLWLLYLVRRHLVDGLCTTCG